MCLDILLLSHFVVCKSRGAKTQTNSVATKQSIPKKRVEEYIGCLVCVDKLPNTQGAVTPSQSKRPVLLYNKQMAFDTFVIPITTTSPNEKTQDFMFELSSANRQQTVVLTRGVILEEFQIDPLLFGRGSGAEGPGFL